MSYYVNRTVHCNTENHRNYEHMKEVILDRHLIKQLLCYAPIREVRPKQRFKNEGLYSFGYLPDCVSLILKNYVIVFDISLKKVSFRSSQVRRGAFHVKDFNLNESDYAQELIYQRKDFLIEVL